MKRDSQWKLALRNEILGIAVSMNSPSGGKKPHP